MLWDGYYLYCERALEVHVSALGVTALKKKKDLLEDQPEALVLTVTS